MEPQKVSGTIASRPFVIETGKLANQATGSAVVSLGETVVLATAVISTPRPGCDFFPLSCDYEEKYYATGKIKGSRFIKREGRPSDAAVLRSRMIDRPIRPLFPKGTTNDIQIIVTVLSADLEVDPATTAINAASAALMVSGAPFAGPIGAVRVGLVEDRLIINPTYVEEEKGDLVLTVAGTLDAITMVEAGSNEISDEKMLEALELAHSEIKKICELQVQLKDKVKPEAVGVLVAEKNAEAIAAVEEVITKADLDTVSGKLKKEIKNAIHALEEKLITAKKAEIEAEKFSEGDLKSLLNDKFEKNLRANVLEKDLRIDGRKLNEVRALSSEVGVLPRTHGSGLFNRGETQILTIATLGGPGKAMIVDTMDKDYERFYMHEYNFPPFSVGESGRRFGPGRREVGHGDLAERALIPVLPSREEFPYTIRVVSETLSCNGSSSMGSVCGSTLALMDAGVPIKNPVSAIAMGMVTDKDAEGKFKNYKILSDIQGFEDFAGDMDFKVARTEKGITALQMDIKVKGVSTDILKEALTQAKVGCDEIRAAILAAIPEARKELNKYAPLIESVKIDPAKIREIIGKGGEMIQKITKECGVEIDVDDDGIVTITAPDQAGGEKAKKWIEQIVYIPKEGDEFDGKVVRIMDFGAFVEISPGKDGMVHISALAPNRIEKVEDAVKIGDIIQVKVVEVDAMGRINLTRVIDGVEMKRAPRPPRPSGDGGRPPRRF
ncbi:polyribonucleotide nucleotidyltransferase [Candidatus Gracilibacteria bacterium]|nr:polyribonucleotide nucleotidyltransferase [Candidatus Gracilibacteria bacterium]MCF7856411.1 polyribonucleotide nucleotidyltransferase [Candidatus Gracilibacteria bacterium]MCF7896284.1 polyribonucleotide nucleotidyltransferase [Candidatus Gracilibacteria bacterium]